MSDIESIFLCAFRSSAQRGSWRQWWRPHLLPVGNGVCRKSGAWHWALVRRMWRSSSLSVCLYFSLSCSCSVNLFCVCCLRFSHGAAVQWGARLDPGGFAVSCRNGLSELQQCRRGVPSCWNNLWIWARSDGERSFCACTETKSLSSVFMLPFVALRSEFKWMGRRCCTSRCLISEQFGRTLVFSSSASRPTSCVWNRKRRVFPREHSRTSNSPSTRVKHPASISFVRVALI